MPGSFITSDLDVILGASDFGEAPGTVLWKGISVTGCIFDEEDIAVDVGDGITQKVTHTELVAKSADFDGITDGDAIQARGISYIVKNWEDDGEGVIIIQLAKAA